MISLTNQFPDFVQEGLRLAKESTISGHSSLELSQRVKDYLSDPDIRSRFFLWSQEHGMITNHLLVDRMLKFVVQSPSLLKVSSETTLFGSASSSSSSSDSSLLCQATSTSSTTIEEVQSADQLLSVYLPKVIVEMIKGMYDYNETLMRVFFQEGVPETYAKPGARLEVIIKSYIQANPKQASEQFDTYIEHSLNEARRSEILDKRKVVEIELLVEAAIEAGVPVTSWLIIQLLPVPISLQLLNSLIDQLENDYSSITSVISQLSNFMTIRRKDLILTHLPALKTLVNKIDPKIKANSFMEIEICNKINSLCWYGKEFEGAISAVINLYMDQIGDEVLGYDELPLSLDECVPLYNKKTKTLVAARNDLIQEAESRPSLIPILTRFQHFFKFPKMTVGEVAKLFHLSSSIVSRNQLVITIRRGSLFSEERGTRLIEFFNVLHTAGIMIEY